MNFVYGGCIPLVHRELLEIFGAQNVARDLYIGRVFNDRGKLLDEWVTARGRRQVVVRGHKDAGYRFCEVCGCLNYCAQGARYLYPAPPADVVICESDLLGFVVPEEISELVAAKGWRRLRPEMLPVLDPPPDGLGVLPEP